MGRKLGEPDQQGILPRTPIEQLEFEAAQQLDTLYRAVSSADAVRAEDELRAKLSPLEKAVLDATFILQEISPIVLEAMARRKTRTVPLSRGRYWIPPLVSGVDYNIGKYPDYYNSPEKGYLSLASNALATQKGSSIAYHMQSIWDSGSNADVHGIIKFGQYKKADLVNLFRGTRPV
jgi:hypothetical protein